MLNNRINAAHLLRLYAWELLSANGVLSIINANGKDWVPIIPIEDEPELRDSGKAYIIYGWSENEENGLHMIQRGNMSFRIIAEDSNQLSYITNVLTMGFRNEDETANSVNWWASLSDYDFKGLRFTWVKTILVESADPATAEGGQVEGSVMVGYRYITSQEVITFKQGSRLNGSTAAWG